MPTPTQRTLAHLRDQGFKCEVVERWNMHSRTRHDLFHIIDIIALDPVNGVLGVQCFSTSFADHIKKMLGEHLDNTVSWLSTPGTKLYLYGWRKVVKQRGSKVMIYKPRIQELTLNNIEEIRADYFDK